MAGQIDDVEVARDGLEEPVLPHDADQLLRLRHDRGVLDLQADPFELLRRLELRSV